MPSTWFIMWCWTWPRGWGGVCQVYHWKVTPVSPLSTLCSLERSYTICHSHFRSKHLHFTSLRVEHLHKLFWILPHRQFVYSPPSIYLYDYGLMDIYFKLWVIIQYYLFCSNCFHFGQSELSHLTHVPLTHRNHSECRVSGLLLFSALSYLLALWDAPGSSCLCPASVLQPAISPHSPNSFYWRIVLETKTCAPGLPVATWVSVLLGSLS